ncbi:hypothetical protein CFAM422_007094 [Trichoderma lentiforme]|uniref:Uncharacterized protein n=1 Tax=Trichoderma lentiforme TaxID=1567552 RepID=A0A9P4XBJ6_9HYPO|nr:hypothetical protein CFAM422_007094 [Trichoderma lentiforme]
MIGLSVALGYGDAIDQFCVYEYGLALQDARINPTLSLAPFASIEMAVCVVKYDEQPIPILTDHFLLAALVLARS